MRRPLVLSLAILSCWLPAQSPEFSLEQVLSSPLPSSLLAAPTRNRIAWVLNTRGEYRIMVGEGHDVAGFKIRELRRFAGDDGRAVTILGFSDDASTLVYRRNQTNGGAGEIFVASLRGEATDRQLLGAATGPLAPRQARMAYARGGEVFVHDLSNERGRRVLKTRGQVSQLCWSPDGKHLAMRIARQSFGSPYSWIGVFDFEHLRYLDPSPHQDAMPRWSPDGRRIAFVRQLSKGTDSVLMAREFPRPDPWDVRVTVLATGETQSMLRRPEPHSFRHAQLGWRDDTRLLFSSERSGWHRLYETTSKQRPRPLSPPNSEVDSFAVGAFGNLFFTSNAHDEDRRHLWIIEPDAEARLWTRGSSIEWGACPLPGTTMIAHFGSDARNPAAVGLRGVHSGPSRPFFDQIPDDFPSAKLVVPEAVEFLAADGQRIHAQLFRPPPQYRGRRPSVMFFHGGPARQMLLGWHPRGYYHNAYGFNQYLATKGYCVLSVNFRLGIGYGKQFRDVTDGGPRGAAEYQDLLAGHAWLAAQDFVDVDRIGLWGGSYGGYMTAMGLSRDSDKFAAGVDFHGVHDWNLWQAWAAGKTKASRNDTARRSSPRGSLAGWRSPVLLVHGDDDRNVPFAETTWLARELRQRGVDHELLILPDEAHSFRRHRSWLEAFNRAAAFLDHKLRDKATAHTRIGRGAGRFEARLADETIAFFTYKPKTYHGQRMILVMHGTLRNAAEYRDDARAMAERFGALVVVPRFDAKRFPANRYHRGGILDANRRAQPAEQWTYAMIPRLANLVRMMEGRPQLPFWILGHSAGGQFVARMSAFQETGAVRHVAANPGSQLFPNRDMPFAYGFGDLPPALSSDATLARYLATPLTIYLGTDDDQPDKYFNQGPTAMRQGGGRLQRGRRCFAQASQLAKQRGWVFNWRLVEAPGVGHDHQQMFDHERCQVALFGK